MTSPGNQARFREAPFTASTGEFTGLVCALMDTAAVAGFPVYYLESPEGEVHLAWESSVEFTCAGEGRFAQVREEIARFSGAENAGAPPWVAGFQFFPEREANGAWAELPNAVCFLPKNYLRLTRFGARSVEGIFTGAAEAAAPALAMRGFRSGSDSPDLLPVSDDGDSARKEWNRSFAEFERARSGGKLQKAVLSRKRAFRFTGNIGCGAVWEKFSRVEFPNAFKFGFLWRGSLFFGASPEPLLIQDGREISVPAVAGTRPRGASPAEDDELARELLGSAKELAEHGYVVDFIRERLGRIAGELVPRRAPDVLRLRAVQHLFTENKIHCEKSPDSLGILESLHPTPAMSGFPETEALAFLRANESHGRGFFASPLGLFDPTRDFARFVVGIRSALLHENSLEVFAGAGLVTGSSADQEWAETERKMQTILRVFDNNGP